MAEKSRSEARIRRHARVRMNVQGTAQRPRLSVFRSLSEIYAQVIDDADQDIQLLPPRPLIRNYAER